MAKKRTWLFLYEGTGDIEISPDGEYSGWLGGQTPVMIGVFGGTFDEAREAALDDLLGNFDEEDVLEAYDRENPEEPEEDEDGDSEKKAERKLKLANEAYKEKLEEGLSCVEIVPDGRHSTLFIN